MSVGNVNLPCSLTCAKDLTIAAKGWWCGGGGGGEPRVAFFLPQIFEARDISLPLLCNKGSERDTT